MNVKDGLEKQFTRIFIVLCHMEIECEGRIKRDTWVYSVDYVSIVN